MCSVVKETRLGGEGLREIMSNEQDSFSSPTQINLKPHNNFGTLLTADSVIKLTTPTVTIPSDESTNPPAGSLHRTVQGYVKNPPIETVLFGWGVSEDCQLGLDSKANIMRPTVVESMLGVQFSGRNFNSPPLVGGSRNTLAIDSEGQVWSWGWNDRGTLGHGHRKKEAKPRRVAALKDVRITQVALGGWHCLALSKEGQVYAWGGNEYLQCGIDEGYRDVLLPTMCVPNLRVRQVACGGMHSLALTEDGQVWVWGEPWGDFSMVLERAPRPVVGVVGVASISCGAFHNMALTWSGEVLTWGTNDHGQLGNGTTMYCMVPQKVQMEEGVKVSDITAGGWHSVVLTTEGEVYVWGRGEYGRLGIGDRTGSTKLRPTKVRGLEGHKVIQVTAGGTHSMALTAAGRLFVWGRAAFGRLGQAPEKDLYSPVEVALPGGHERWRVICAAAGGRHSMCLAMPVREGSAYMGEIDDEIPDGNSEPSLFDKDFTYHTEMLTTSDRAASSVIAAEWQEELAGDNEVEDDDEETTEETTDERDMSGDSEEEVIGGLLSEEGVDAGDPSVIATDIRLAEQMRIAALSPRSQRMSASSNLRPSSPLGIPRSSSPAPHRGSPGGLVSYAASPRERFVHAQHSFSHQ